MGDSRRIRIALISLLAVLGCSRLDSAEQQEPAAEIIEGFGELAAEVFRHPGQAHLAATGELVLTRGSSIGPGERLVVAPSSRVIDMHLSAGRVLRIHEEGLLGGGRAASGTIAVPRVDGTSYWTVAPEHGFEEWLVLEAGIAYADRIVGRWTVEDATLRELPDGGVHVLGAEGSPLAYVTAPHAWAVDGDEVSVILSVEGDAIVARVDAEGRRVLVDPLWVPTGMMLTPRDQAESTEIAVGVPGGVIIAGGSRPALASVERYDIATGVWSSRASMPRASVAHSITLMSDGRILAAGGWTSFTSRADLYDPIADTCRADPTCPLCAAGTPQPCSETDACW